jgi:hypothetical protein
MNLGLWLLCDPCRPVSLFNKLPHHMERLLREVPVTDGLNVDVLLQFLQKVIELRNHFH